MSGFVYFLRPVGAEGPIKIGHSTNPTDRLRDCTVHSPVPLELIATLPVEERETRRSQLHMERRFHVKYASQRTHAEWFTACPELLADIEAISAGTFDPETLPRAFWIATNRKAA